MRPAQILKEIASGKTIESVEFDGVGLDEHNAVQAVIATGKSIKSLVFKEVVFRDSFAQLLQVSLSSHQSLQEISFKECTFDTNAAAILAKSLEENRNLQRFTCETMGNDEDLAKLISGLAKQGRIQYLSLDYCTTIGEKSIAALANLIRQGAKSLHLSITNSFFSSNIELLIAACREVSREVNWNLNDSESLGTNNQLAALLQAKKHSIFVAASSHGWHANNAGNGDSNIDKGTPTIPPSAATPKH